MFSSPTRYMHVDHYELMKITFMYMYLRWWYSATNTRNKTEPLNRTLCAYAISYYITYQETDSDKINLQYTLYSRVPL